jgi:hypothetical protein
MSKKNRHEYYRGRNGQKYGIYHTAAKCIQFDIREDTPMLAQARLFQKIGDDAHKGRFEPRALPPDGLRAHVTLIDEMHTVKPAGMLPASKKASVHLYYSEEEAALLFDLLYSKMEDLMSLNTKDRLSEEPIFDQEQRDYLHHAMQFCAEQLKALAKYANVGDTEG